MKKAQNSSPERRTNDLILTENYPTSKESTPFLKAAYGEESQKFCKACGCDRTNIIKMPSHSQHYAQLRCGDCDTFRGWLPKPKNEDRRARDREAIAQLLKNPTLTTWECDFLTSIKKRKSLSPKQKERLSILIATKGGQY